MFSINEVLWKQTNLHFHLQTKHLKEYNDSAASKPSSGASNDKEKVALDDGKYVSDSGKNPAYDSDYNPSHSSTSEVFSLLQKTNKLSVLLSCLRHATL